MSFEALRLGWEQALPSTLKLVLIALCDYADSEGFCWPGKPHIAVKCGLTERAVQKSLLELKTRGLIRIERRFRDNGSQKSNGYVVLPGLLQPVLMPEKLRVAGREHHSPPREPTFDNSQLSHRGEESRSPPPRTTCPPLNHQSETSKEPPPQPRGMPASESESLQRAMPENREVIGASDPMAEELVFPDAIELQSRAAASEILAPLPIGRRQEILDELAGRCSSGAIRNVLGYLRALVRKAGTGTFTPDFAGKVKAARESRARHLSEMAERLGRHADAKADPPSPETKARLRNLRNQLAGTAATPASRRPPRTFDPSTPA